MCHALIIDDNMIVSRAVQSYLVPLGFSTFDLTWTEGQALAAASRRVPDLIVNGDELEAGSAMAAAREIAGELNVPVLMVTGDSFRAQQRLDGATATFHGPFFLNQIEEAVTLARAALGRCSPSRSCAPADCSMAAAAEPGHTSPSPRTYALEPRNG